MSTGEDDSSPQIQKLVRSPGTTRKFTFIKVGESQRIGHGHSMPNTPLTFSGRTSPGRDSCSASTPRINPDKCYSWPRPDDVITSKRSKHRSGSVTSTSSSSVPMPTPPDGGWGWFVVLGAFMICLICDGLAYCFGVLYSELLVQFKESRSKTSLVGSIFFSASMIMGPLASALTTRFGCRTMAVFGGFLSSFGFLLSSFANSIDMLCFTFSIIVGMGFSFCYITSVVIVSFYFEKRRALATGLAVCGTGIGTVTFAPLMDYLIVEYGWRGMFLIMSGISLNLVVCGMLFRPLSFSDKERWQMLLCEFNKIPNSREELEMSRSRYTSESSDVETDESVSEEDPKTLSVLSLPTFVTKKILGPPSALLIKALQNSNNPHLILQRYMKNAMLQLELGHPRKYETSVDDGTYNHTRSTEHLKTEEEDLIDTLPSSLPIDSVLNPSQSPKIVMGKKHLSNNDINQNPKVSDKHVKYSPATPVRKTSRKENDEASRKMLEERELTNDANPGNLHPAKLKSSGMESRNLTSHISTHGDEELHDRPQEYAPFNGNEIGGNLVSRSMSRVHMGRHSAYSIHLPLYRSDIFYRQRVKESNTPLGCTLGTSCPELYEPVGNKNKRSYLCRLLLTFLKELRDILRSMIDCHLFRIPFFIVFCFSNFLFYFWSDVPYMYAADHAVNNGVDPRKATFFLSIIGIFNTVGQVVFGMVGDLNINLINVYAIVSVIAGVTVAFIPLMQTYVTACIVYALFGFFVSVSYPLTTVLLIKFMGVTRLANAYGLLMLIQGIANLFGPPFAGWVSDQTGKYDSTFYLSGFFYALSGLVLFLLYIPKLGKTPEIVSALVIEERGVGNVDLN